MKATHRIKVHHKGVDGVVLGYRHSNGVWMQWPDHAPVQGDMRQIQNLATRAVVKQMKTPSVFKDLKK